MKLIVAIFFFCSCKQGNVPFSVVAFHNAPPEVETGYFFGETKDTLKKGNFLAVQDFDSTAFVMLNSRLTEFRLTESKYDKESRELSETYEQMGYKLRINVTFKEDKIDFYHFSGELSMEDKDGWVWKKDIVGYTLSE
jgi:hypothetical protein